MFTLSDKAELAEEKKADLDKKKQSWSGHAVSFVCPLMNLQSVSLIHC